MLEAARVAIGGGGTLDVPVAEAELADGAKVAAAGAVFAVEEAGDQPGGAFECRSNGLAEFWGDQSAGDIEGEHVLENLSLPTHYIQ